MRIIDWSSDVCSSDLQVMTDHGIRPAGQPKIEIVSFDDGKDLEYTMAVEQIPEIKPMDFATLELETLKVDVPEYEIEDMVAVLRPEARRVGKGRVRVCRYRGAATN